MSLLTIITDVCGRLSLPQPAMVAGSTDKQVIQLLALANQEGKSLARKYRWQALTEQTTFVTVAVAGQGGAVPDDFDRFVPDSFYNRTTRRQVLGPMTPQDWQLVQAQPVSSLLYLSYRQRTAQFLLSPTPPAGQTIAYEYVSKNWCESNSAVPQAIFMADEDTAFLDEECITLGVIWRFLKAKGLDYAEEMETYEREVEQVIARDGGSGALNIAPQPPDPARINLPDGNFGV